MQISGKQLTQGAIVARVFAGGTCAVELDAAYAADIILGHVPSPRGHRVPFFDGDFHVVLNAAQSNSKALGVSIKVRKGWNARVEWIGVV